MKYWRAFLILIGLGCFFVALERLDAERITSIDQRAVEIATLPCVGIQSTSTGFVIDDQTVVTVAHAIHESRDFALRDAFGTWHRADLLVLDRERDLAILHVEDLRATPMVFAERRPVDEWPEVPVRMLNGAATGPAAAEIVRRVSIATEVVGDRSQQSNRSGYEVALQIGPGDSGAALVDGDDDLVAVVFARSSSREGITWATAADEIEVSPTAVEPWECDDDVEVELDLRPPEPRRLAG